jgi:hypothetical protein
MKKEYLKPSAEVNEIAAVGMIASSPDFPIGGDVENGTTDVAGYRGGWNWF